MDDIVDSLVRSSAVDIIVVDSVAALTPKAEIEGDMGDSHVGLQARLMSQALRKLSGVISDSNCVVIFINQLRETVGVMYGNPNDPTYSGLFNVRKRLRSIYGSQCVFSIQSTPKGSTVSISIPLTPPEHGASPAEKE